MRVRAEFYDRTSVYMQGILMLDEALKSFQSIGSVIRMEVYKEGKRVTVWTEEDEWRA